ncbi:hypothetical protein J5277_09665 [Rhizobium sp. 16-449-1b]|uniref:hypothetical protein n=1 Tax=Rhizobium sp. 16-449-1b TaxID=2819989 RepID=UPI001ADD0979|nr:hypothetical protein [Rhizobium sp. 16-449-1b]MBO9194372.1 hypothetical protein [Rhizobium sp. 16-449-1b]
MQLRDKAATADMFAMRQEGASFQRIAARWGITPSAVKMRLSRDFRGLGQRVTPAELAAKAANDNNPDRKTVLSPHNGGCSTLSGMMPVSVRRVETVELDDEDLRAGQLVAEYALRRELQVAA